MGILIKEIYMFDNEIPYIKDKKSFANNVKQVFLKYFCETNSFKKYKIDEEVDIKIIFLDDDGNDYTFSLKENEQPIENNWRNNIEQLFTKDEGMFILCDYKWEEDEDIIDRIYQCIENNPKAIFVCYSTIDVNAAQVWISSIIKEQEEKQKKDDLYKSCYILREALALSKDGCEMIQSLREVMLDEW